ncbi:hypothetical protein SEPCBS119000_006479 [Sporothrix epigloea]|uniref:Protein kinase domain-containing protein n=1 Tax=Sporothrix epigloea TaxID=1892477 RepID=A0ABP0E7E8_9PEZI
MDLSIRAIHDVVHATAAFAGLTDDSSSEESDLGHDIKASSSPSCDSSSPDSEEHRFWAESQLNPKNRIDSLEPIARPLWLIDGAAQFGTQFFARPVFFSGRPPPMHIGVLIEEGAAYPRSLRRLLDLDQAFHTKDRDRLLRLGIASHVQRILQYHTTSKDGHLRPDVARNLFWQGPFGSLIIIHNLTFHVGESRLEIYRNHALEGELKSYAELKTMWGLADDGRENSLPPEIDIARVGLVQQVHDSINIVYIHSEQKDDESREGEGTDAVVLKSASSPAKFLYHELRALLRDIPPHPGILARPLHIVTKKCLFGRKAGVVGFTMPLYPQGTLGAALPFLRMHGALASDVQLRWCRQITDVLLHIWTQGRNFYYPDLHLDNVVLSGDSPTGDIGLVDFEQRGAWCSSSSPEVDYLESLRVLAFDDQEYEYANAQDVCSEHLQKLIACYDAAALVDPRPPQAAHTSSKRHAIVCLQELNNYSNPLHGFNVPWACLTNPEREAAMVYMLGRLMWCICEGVSAPQRGAVWQSCPREPELEFPTFCRTPEAMKTIILKCFGDAGARQQSQFVRQGSKLYIKEPLDVVLDGDGKRETCRPNYKLSDENISLKARDFWHRRLAEGDSWLRHRNESLLKRAEKDGNAAADLVISEEEKTEERDTDGPNSKLSAHGRPTLWQVQKWLGELSSENLTKM